MLRRSEACRDGMCMAGVKAERRETKIISNDKLLQLKVNKTDSFINPLLIELTIC